MPNDKRPKPTIDMAAERVVEPSKPLLSAGGATSGGEGAAAQKPSAAQGPAPAKAQRNGPSFAGYLLAGLIGGAVIAGCGYLASRMEISGFSLTDPGTRQRIAELEERTASLESALRVLSRPAPAAAYEPSGAGGEGVNELRSRLDGLVDAARGLDQTVQSLSQKVQALEQRPAGGAARETLQAEIAAQTAPLQQRLSSAERELETLTRAQSERLADARTASLTLALTNLKRAIADGRPFPAELAAVETLSAAKLPVSQLAPYKDTGVSSMAELQGEFAEASKKTVEAYYSEKSSGFMGEVLSRAKSVVQIKPADSTGGSVEAILGRMSTALKSGDLKTALLQGAGLPHPPLEMMDWFGKAQARLTADEALRKTDQELLAALTRPPARHQ